MRLQGLFLHPDDFRSGHWHFSPKGKRRPWERTRQGPQALARILLPKIQAFFEGEEEGQLEFAEWKAQQEKNKVK